MQPRACNCIGPQNGDPACPCAMVGYRERELGKKALEAIGTKCERCGTSAPATFWPLCNRPECEYRPPADAKDVWRLIADDPQLANARRKLSMHEFRLIIKHAREA